MPALKSSSVTSLKKAIFSARSKCLKASNKISRLFRKILKSVIVKRGSLLIVTLALILIVTCIILLLFSLFPRSIFPLSTSKLQSHASSSFDTDRRRISIAVVASRSNHYSDVHLTIQSISSLNVDVDFELVHFADEPNPAFAALIPNYRQISSRCPYDDPLRVWAQGSAPTLMVAAGVHFASRALDWLNAARAIYANRLDVAAFALDPIVPLFMPEDSNHLADKWIPVKALPENDAFLYRACPPTLAIMFNDQGPFFQPWITFYDWINARKGEWYRYPSGPGIEDTPFDMTEVMHRNWTQGTWNVWFTQFLHEHKLGVVYPNIDGSLIASSKTSTSSVFSPNLLIHESQSKWKLSEALPTFLSTGVPDRPGSIPLETINTIVDLGKQQGFVSFTVVDRESVRLARSWLCNVDSGGFRPHGLVWATTDSESYSALKQIFNTTTIRISEDDSGNGAEKKSTISKQLEVMLKRTSVISELLNRGVAVFVFDLDSTWLRNPLPHFDELVSQGADLIGTVNSQFKVPTNFLYLVPTLPTRQLWNEMNTSLHEAHTKSGFAQNKNESDKDLHVDTDRLTSLLLGSSGWRERHPLTFMSLSGDKVASSQWHDIKDDMHYPKRGQRPIVVNNDRIFDVEEKVSRAKNHSMWFWDEKKKECSLYLAQSVLLVYGENSSTR